MFFGAALSALKDEMATTIIRVLDMHTGGEPVRIVTEVYPPIPGDTILAASEASVGTPFWIVLMAGFFIVSLPGSPSP